MYVASNGKADLVHLLLARGANPHLRNLDDFSALDLAASLPCLKLLKAGCAKTDDSLAKVNVSIP